MEFHLDTIRRVFLLLNPIEFQECFQNWASDFKNKIIGETIAIDGKALRGSRDDVLGKKAIYMVSAWANENQKNIAEQIKGDGPANSAVLKHITLNLLKREKTLKRSINTKRSHACMDLSYLEKVVFG